MKKISYQKNMLRLVVIIFSLSLLGACSKPEQPKEGQALPVSVYKVEKKEVNLDSNLTGRLVPSRKAEVRARVDGVIKKRYFTEGSYVKSGQKLYLIDDGIMQANLAKAKANFAKASGDLNKMKPLLEEKAISKQEYDAVLQAYRVAQADVKTAEINLGYAHVTAPISGKIGKSYETEGALVGQGAATLLAVIQQTDPIEVEMSQSAYDVMQLKKSIAEGSLETVGGNPEVEVLFSDGSVYPIKGNLLFTDSTVDEKTGQITLKARIPNPNDILLPGLFVKIRTSISKASDVYLVPKQAVTRSNEGDSLFVVKEDGTYMSIPIKIAQEQGRFWVVIDGLEEGQLVLLESMAKLSTFNIKKVQPEIANSKFENEEETNLQSTDEETKTHKSEE